VVKLAQSFYFSLTNFLSLHFPGSRLHTKFSYLRSGLGLLHKYHQHGPTMRDAQPIKHWNDLNTISCQTIENQTMHRDVYFHNAAVDL